MSEICRFAPTPSGPAHPGTLLAALLCWLDARARGARLLLRLEDVDPLRCTPEHARGLVDAWGWLGLDQDEVMAQASRRDRHEAALLTLAEQGSLYRCTCSRKQIRASARPAADGGFVYPGTCRGNAVGADDLDAAPGALRLRLDPGRVALRDESGADLSAEPAVSLGDPVLRRRDGAIAYHLAVVVDDAEQAVTRVVRGRDLAPATALHVVLQRRLGFATPVYRHHFLLLERQGDAKLAKLHGSVGWQELRARYSGAELCGWLACAAGLLAEPRPITPQELLADFDWARVPTQDRVVDWRAGRLVLDASP